MHTLTHINIAGVESATPSDVESDAESHLHAALDDDAVLLRRRTERRRAALLGTHIYTYIHVSSSKRF
jgi:hypothetical protein